MTAGPDAVTSRAWPWMGMSAGSILTFVGRFGVVTLTSLPIVPNLHLVVGIALSTAGAVVLVHRRGHTIGRLLVVMGGDCAVINPWLLAALAPYVSTVEAVMLLLFVAAAVMHVLGEASLAMWVVVIGVGFGALPTAIGLAAVRYRLYDIDRLVSRTITYGVVVGLLVAVHGVAGGAVARRRGATPRWIVRGAKIPGDRLEGRTVSRPVRVRSVHPGERRPGGHHDRASRQGAGMARDWQERLERLVVDDDVPGAALGILSDGQTRVHVAGMANRPAGIEATPDTVFQIGSVTKVWTATQVMLLADAGRLDLDDPVRRHLPDFKLVDEHAASHVTIHHLLTHTSGIEGDVFDDVGTNDDCLERYVAALASQGTVHDLDETWSYCNSGWVVLGRIVEVLTGSTWGAALQEQLGGPLTMQALCTTPSQAILHRAAVGHLPLPGTAGLSRAPQWDLPRALGPAGLVTCTISDLLAFARLHLDGGVAPDGTRLLADDTVALMQQRHADCPEELLATGWGLGWMRNTWSGKVVIGHGGNTIGQSALLYLVPEDGIAVALLTNVGSRSDALFRLVREVLLEEAGVEMPPRPAPADGPVEQDLDAYVGDYQRYTVRTQIERDADGLHGRITMSGPTAASLGLTEPLAIRLHPVRPGQFVTSLPQFGEGWVPVRFHGDDDGRARFMHMGARVARRVPADA